MRVERQAGTLFAAAVALAVLALWFLGRDLSFSSDELGWLTFGDDLGPRTLLTPHNSHLIAVPRAIYEVLPRVFGASYVPFRILALAGTIACATLLFVLLRRRVGGAPALAGATVILFFGSAPDITLSSLGLPFTWAIAFGLGAMALLERPKPSTDAAACGLLLLATLSHTFGPVIAIGVLVHLLANPARRPRLWTAGLPLLLWIIWWVWARQFDQGITAGSNILGAPLFVLKSAAAAIVALLGVGPSSGPVPDWLEPVAAVIAIGCAVAGAALLVKRRRRDGGGWLLAYLVIACAFWVGTALAASDHRQPTTPRYLFFGAIMVALIAGEAFRGRHLGRRGALALGGVFLVAFVGNAFRLAVGADGLTDQTSDVRAQIAMIELGGKAVPAAFTPRSVPPRGSDRIAVPAQALQEFAAEHGSLGFTLESCEINPSRSARMRISSWLARRDYPSSPRTPCRPPPIHVALSSLGRTVEQRCHSGRRCCGRRTASRK